MLRPNRIGHSQIHQLGGVISTADWTPNLRPLYSSDWQANVLNAVPSADFGEVLLSWVGSEVITADARLVIGQQFSITQPLAGNIAGLEVNGAAFCDLEASAIITPVIGRLDAAGGALFAAVAFATGELPTFFRGHEEQTTAAARRSFSYKEQFIINDDDLAGVYLHGWCIMDGSADGVTFTSLQASLSVRQFNDLQNQRVRDPLR